MNVRKQFASTGEGWMKLVGGSSDMLVFIRLDVAPVGVHTTRGRRRPAEEDGKIRGSAGFLLQGHRLEWKAEREAEKLHCTANVALPCACAAAPTDGRLSLKTRSPRHDKASFTDVCRDGGHATSPRHGRTSSSLSFFFLFLYFFPPLTNDSNGERGEGILRRCHLHTRQQR